MLIFSSNLPLSIVGVDRAPIAAAATMESCAVLPPTAPVSALISDTRHFAGNPGLESVILLRAHDRRR